MLWDSIMAFWRKQNNSTENSGTNYRNRKQIFGQGGRGVEEGGVEHGDPLEVR